MKIVANILVALVAIEHIYILVLEMFLWTSQRGLDTFGFDLEFAESTTVLAANQGLYNGFLAAGLITSLIVSNRSVAMAFKYFFLICVIVAAIFGGITVGPRIAIVQGIPALAALVFVWLTNRS